MLYTAAFNEKGIFVKANCADKNEIYFCPVCKNKLILKKSGNTGKGSKRPHFAHYFLPKNCTPESALHYSFKKLLYDKIVYSINNKLPINIVWECDYCNEDHKGNLLKNVFGVMVEYDLGICKPDMALFNKNVFAVIEIIVTHYPEDTAINFYKDNKIILIQLALNSEAGLENIDTKIENPSSVDFCFNPKCLICGDYKVKRELLISTGDCYRCGHLMNVCCLNVSRVYTINPESFTAGEINFARSKGVLLETRFSKTEGRKYIANVCPYCRAFVGNFYLKDYFLGNESVSKYFMGYYCHKCC